jgi:hypothetical protein
VTTRRALATARAVTFLSAGVPQMLAAPSSHLLTDVTPSYVPLSPFGQQAAEKKSLLDKLADIAEKATNVATALNAPKGAVVTAYAPTQSPGAIMNFDFNSFLTSPVFLIGAAAVAVLLLRKK